MATTQHRQHTTHAFKQLAHILRTILAALNNMSEYTEEHVKYLTCFIETAIETAGADVDKLAAIFDADLRHVTARCDLQGKMTLSVEHNVEHARYTPAGMASDGDEDEDEDGLQIGDDFEKFWAEVASDESEGGEGEGEMEEVEIDVKATNKAVSKWLRKRCARPEECEDIFEEV